MLAWLTLLSKSYPWPPIFVLYMKIMYFYQQESHFVFTMSILYKFSSALNFNMNILFITIDAYVCGTHRLQHACRSQRT